MLVLHAQNSTRGFLYLINKEPTFVICFGEGGLHFELDLVGEQLSYVVVVGAVALLVAVVLVVVDVCVWPTLCSTNS